jgi:hypothetical protein
MSRKSRLYEEVVRRRGCIRGQADWKEVGQTSGYPLGRALAGFFGGRRPSMIRLPDGSRVLTADGWRRAKRI